MNQIPAEDHRARVARARRERMRARLLDAVLSVYPGDLQNGPAVIDDVIRAAHVSRGTFYKYFPSLEEAVSELGIRLAEENVKSVTELHGDLTDPLLRPATGFQLYLSRAAIEPKWGAFVTRMSDVMPDGQLMQIVTENLRSGTALGVFDIRAMDAAVDLAFGALIQAMKHIVTGKPSPGAYIERVSAMLLRSFGVPPDASDKAAREAFEYLCRVGPQKLPWWRPFD